MGIWDRAFGDPEDGRGLMTRTRVMSAATTNATSLKVTGGKLYSIRLFNTSAATKYLKFYDKTSAPTVGTDTPIWTLPLPAGGGFSDQFLYGIDFTNGVAFAITGAVADSDTTATAVNDIVGIILWM